MDADEALKVVEKALNDERLSKLQAIVFRYTWDEWSYQAIAKSAGYEVGYIKQTGSQLWQILSTAFGEKVNKSNLQSVLRRYSRSPLRVGNLTAALPDDTARRVSNLQTSVCPDSLTATHFELQATHAHQDWGEATDVSAFYGRSTELKTLEQWVLEDGCRLVGLFGMGGIGKTALSVRLAKQIQTKFDYVMWRSLRNAPPIHSFLNDVLQFVSGQPTPEFLPATHILDQQMLRLLHYLRLHRCLLILDNLETVMQAGDRNGSYQPGYEGYGQLLRCVGETQHQSCLLITSREKPKGLAPKEGDNLPIRSLQLTGLSPTTGRELLSVKGTFSGSTAEWQSLVTHYAGNPLALKIVATAIADFFDGNLTQFLDFSQQGGSVFGDIRDLLTRQIGRLSDLEQQVMLWLAINREPVRFADLQSDCLPPISPADLLETLTALERRSLIETSSSRFTLQPVVMEYITEQLIDGGCAEIEGLRQQDAEGEQHSTLNNLSPPLLRSHALIKAQTQDYVRETQIRLILTPIVDRLLHTSSRADLDQCLMELVESLRGKAAQAIGYIGGNVLNLLCQLQVHRRNGETIDPADIQPGGRWRDWGLCTLRDRDFSHLTIWQAYLQNVSLHRTNFSYSDLSKSVFAETFSQILGVAFSADGQLLAASDISYEVHVWRVADGKKLLTCKAKDGWAWSVAFSPDQRLLASSANGTIHLWDLQTGDCVQTLQGYTSRVFSLAFSPDGTYLASGSEDQQVRLWIVATGILTAVLTEHTDEVHSVAFSPDGCLLASGSYDRTVKLWDVSWLKGRETEGKRQKVKGTSQETTAAVSETVRRANQQHTTQAICSAITLTGHTHWVWSVAFSADGQTLASSSSDRTIKLWDLPTYQCRKTLIGHSQAVRSLAFAPSENSNSVCLVSGSDDRTIRLWNQQGDCLRVLQGHTSWLSAVAFSPNGCLLASGSEDQSVRLWDSRTNQCLRLLQGYNSGVWSIAFSPNGRTLVSGGQDRMIRLWTVHDRDAIANERSEAKEPESNVDSVSTQYSERPPAASHLTPHTLKGHISWVWSVAFSPDGRTIASGSEDGTVRAWEISASGKGHREDAVLRGHTHAVWSVAFSPDGQIIASGSLDGTIRLWHYALGWQQQVLQEHQSGVWSVAFAPQWQQRQGNQQLLASGGQDQTIRLWAVSTQGGTQGGESSAIAVQHLTTLTGHTSWIRCVAFSADGSLLASGSSDGSLILWDTETGDRLHTFQAHPSLVLAVTFSPDDQVLASSGGDGIIQLWDLTCVRRQQSSLNAPQNDGASYQGADPSERQSVERQNGDDSEPLDIRSTDARSTPPSPAVVPPRVLQTLQGHHNWVRCLTYSPDGTLLASCSQDGTIKVWEANCQLQRLSANSSSASATIPLTTLRVQRPYEGAIITGVTGLTPAQKDTLRLLGAIEPPTVKASN